MKKILMFSGILLACFTAKAQKAHFGIKGGLNMSNVDATNYNTKYTPGFHVGLLAHIHAAKKLGIQPELLYSTQGGKDKNTDLKLKLDYINIPVMFQYFINDGWRLETGPQAGFLINSKSKLGSVTTDLKEYTDKFDFSWGFGVGYITHSKWGVDARFNLGLTNNSNQDAVSVKNRVFQIGLFYQFDKR